MPGFDYAAGGVFFVTVCTADRACLFGEVVDCEMRLNEAGQLAVDGWKAIAVHRSNVELDAFVVMPNHVHGILRLAVVGATLASPALLPSTRHAKGPRPSSLGAVVGAFKSDVSRRLRRAGMTVRDPIWQRDYYEHLVRDDHALDRIRNYIAANPARWMNDPENPSNGRRDRAALDGNEPWCV